MILIGCNELESKHIHLHHKQTELIQCNEEAADGGGGGSGSGSGGSGGEAMMGPGGAGRLGRHGYVQ